MTFPHCLKFVLLLMCCMQHALASNSSTHVTTNSSSAYVENTSTPVTTSSVMSTVLNGERYFFILKNKAQQNENLTVWGKVGIWVSRDMSLKKLCLIFNSSLSCFLLFSRFLFYTIIFFSVWNCLDQHLFIKTVIVRFTESLFHSCLYINWKLTALAGPVWNIEGPSLSRNLCWQQWQVTKGKNMMNS